MICPYCKKDFIKKYPVQKFCCKQCTERFHCHKFYSENRKKQQKRCLKNYHKDIKDPKKYRRIRKVNMKANAKRRFGVADRGEILKLFDNKCVLCGSTKNLAIHHIDNNGRRKKTPNNDPKNLSVICHLCHYKTHVHKSITEEDIVRAMRQRIEVGRNDQPSKE